MSARSRPVIGLFAAAALIGGCLAACSNGSSAGSAPAGADWVQRAVVGSARVVDSTGGVWTHGSGFSGGSVRAVSGPVAGTNTPELFAFADDGVTSYRTTVPRPGTYAVALYFADTTCAAAGCRVFGVDVDGHPVARHLDIAATVGGGQSLTIVTRATVTGGRLDVQFVPQTGSTTVSAVEVAALPGSHGSLEWHDDFNGSAGDAPDPEKWHHDLGGGGWGNQELETYTNAPANAHLDGMGHLLLTATHQQGPNVPAYASARLTTAGRFDFRYGVLRTRVAVPLGQGLWPAVWMVGGDIADEGWPASGEIDVMETDGADPDRVAVHLLGPQSAGAHYSIGASSVVDGSPTGYHVYQVTWTPIGIGFSVDGESYFGLTPLDLVPAEQGWVFNRPFQILLDLAVGGTFPGDPSSTTPFPAVMSVDYVRVYR